MSDAAFDAMAVDYDRSFTDSAVGRAMRAAVWRRLAARFGPGQRVLELNCGTGEDAVWLARRGVEVLATDVSGEMVRRAAAKAAAAGVSDRVTTRRLPIEQVEPRLGVFDGLLSDFGGLNCVADLRAAAGAVAGCLHRGAVAVLCVMGPAVPWEWGWYLARCQPAKAVRRLRPGGVPWRGLTIRYPTVGAVSRAFAPWFRPLRHAAVGALVPPSYAEAWAQRHGRALRWLAALERRWECHPALVGLADHYLVELERR